MAACRVCIFFLSAFPYVWFFPVGVSDGPSEVSLACGRRDGYLNPCRCSSPMIGGLARRANTLRCGSKRFVVRVDNGKRAPRT